MALPVFALKDYQRATLDRLRSYLDETVRQGDGDLAFMKLTRDTYQKVPALDAVPYVCLRIPTGGGKTVIAAHSIAVAADAYLRNDAPTVLWFTPSHTIREQTLATLQDRAHPNRRALADRFGENVRVMPLQEALYAKRADYDGGLVVIVATIQSFRIDDKEGRKVYAANGELMDHFSGLPEPLRLLLEPGPAGDPVPSLANVLRLRRPMVIIDEAHNVRTDLSFETLARLSPSLVLELTATPVRPDEHNPVKGLYASNVLHHVSAAELKAAEMIKLPVVLRGRADPKETVGDAIAWLDELHGHAGAEEQASGEFLRPIMLLQAEARSKDRATLHADELRRLLVEDFRVPEEHVVVATGDTKGLDGVDLFARDCKVRFVITQQALKEGWDCSFAYVLCSVAEQKSARTVEQLLGRVLRLPRAKRKAEEVLNRAYAFATTTTFAQAAATLRDGLVGNGFERIEALALIRQGDPPIPGMEEGGTAFVYDEPLPEGTDAAAFKLTVEAATGGRIEVDVEAGRLRARGAVTSYDHKSMLLAVPPALAATVDALVHRSRGARLRPPAEDREPVRLAVPLLAVRGSRGPEIFDRAHFLDIPWKLEACDATPILSYFVTPGAGEEAVIDVTAAGKVMINPVDTLHEQLALALGERGWNRSALINWLDRRLPIPSRRDVTRLSSTLFIGKVLDLLEQRSRQSLEQLARAKYRILDALEKVIGQHRAERETSAYQRALLPQSGLDFETSSEVQMVFEEATYGYRQPYRGALAFTKHLFRVVGDLDEKGEEFDCAAHLDRHPAVKHWVRNTDRQPGSFWLQTASDKFYPDFVAQLTDGRILVVEYKGAHLADTADAREKQLVGDLWAERSGGRCLFVMVSDRQFGKLEQGIGASQNG